MVGEVRKGREIGKQANRSHILSPCQICGKERWVVLHKGLPLHTMCRTCGQSGKHKNELNGNWIDGRANTNLYRRWLDIKKRCFNKNSKTYKNYGGRGIGICSEWLDFMTFREWALSNGYKDNLTIDRIDNDGNYEPYNCRWITNSENVGKRNKEYVLAKR